jgi:hypothetical protein
VQYRQPDVTEIKLDEVQTIPLDVLKTLISHATEQEKLWIGLSLNCAYGCDQLGRLQCEWIDFSQQQIKGARFKRATASRHYIWTANAKRLQLAVGGRTSGTVFLDDAGQPVYHVTDAGNLSDAISRAWETQLYKRVRKVEGKAFPYFSYGKLRKTATTLTLERADPSIASMLLAHKTISDDELLAAYAKLPWEKLYQVQKQLEAELAGSLGL